MAREDDKNEYFAGGQSEDGGGSATVLLYPDEDVDTNSTSNATDAVEEEAPKSAFDSHKGGRKL